MLNTHTLPVVHVNTFSHACLFIDILMHGSFMWKIKLCLKTKFKSAFWNILQLWNVFRCFVVFFFPEEFKRLMSAVTRSTAKLRNTPGPDSDTLAHRSPDNLIFTSSYPLQRHRTVPALSPAQHQEVWGRGSSVLPWLPPAPSRTLPAPSNGASH